jgi:hypothetical protein
MKQRNVMAVIIFSIITLGIYDLFWLVKVKNELNAKTDIKTPSIWLLFAPYLALLVPTVAVIALVSIDNGSRAPSTATFNVITIVGYLLAILVILPVTFYWFLKFSKAVNHYTNGELNTAVTFLLLWMLRFIGLAIIQDKFNDMLAAGPSNSSPQTTESVPTSSDATPVQSATNYVAEQPIQTSTIDPTSAPATDVTDNENTSSQPPSVPQA